MAVTKDVTWLVSPAENKPTAVGYIVVSSPDTLTAIIDCGFRPSRVEITYCVPGTVDSAKSPLKLDVVRGVYAEATLGGIGGTPVAKQCPDPAALGSTLFGDFYDVGMSASQDGCHGWKINNTALTLSYTHVVMVFHR